MNIQALDTRRVLLLLSKNTLLFLGGVLIALVASFLFLRYTVPVYKASGQIKIAVDESYNPFGSRGLGAGDLAGNSSLNNEAEIFKSKQMLLTVVKRLGLNQEYFSVGRFQNSFLAQLPFQLQVVANDTTLPRIVNFNVWENGEIFAVDPNSGQSTLVVSGREYLVGGVTFKLNYSSDSLNNFAGANYQVIFRSLEDAAKILSASLTVNSIANSSLFTISHEGTNQLVSQRIVNTLMDIYLQRELELKRKTYDLQIDFIASLIDSYGLALKQASQNLSNFERTNDAYLVNESKSFELGQINNLLTRQIEIKARQSIIDKFLANLNSQLMDSNFQVLPFTITEYSSPLSQNYFQELVVAHNQSVLSYQNLLASSNLPSSIPVKLAFRDIQSRLSEIIRILTIYKSTFTEELRLIQSDLSGLKSNLERYPSVIRELTSTSRGYELLEKSYFDFIQQRNQILIIRASLVSSSEVLDYSSSQSPKIYPQSLPIYLGTIFLSLLIVSGIVVSRELARTKIYTSEDIQDQYSIPLIAEVPLINKSFQEQALEVIISPQSPESEAFRSIRSNIQFLTYKHTKKIICVTSTVSGEGKSFISINLASICTLLKKRVVLVDLDLRKPRLHSFFDLDNSYGITNLLVGQKDIPSVAQSSGYYNLDIITSGPLPPNPSELLGSDELVKVLSGLQEYYDYIILDTAPVGLVTDTIPIIENAHITIHVLRARYSHRKNAQFVAKLKDSRKLGAIYFVLNGTNVNDKKFGYGYSTYSNYFSPTEKKGNLISRALERIHFF